MAKRTKQILASIGIALVPWLAVAQQPSWQVIKIQDRDYLTADNIAQFYRLSGSPKMVEGRWFVGDGRASLEFGSNPREVFVNGVKHWLSFPVVSNDGQILVSRFDLAKTIEPSLRPAMISSLQPFHTVVIDAGHGGQDRGASSAVGYEKDYALNVAGNLKKALEARGLQVILTRSGDSYLTLEQRAEKTNATDDAIFVSLHFNSETNGTSANGFEVYAMTPRGAASTGDGAISADQFKAMPGNNCDDASLALATSVQHSLLGHLPEFDRGVRRARFAVLRLTHTPAILVEGGFLTNTPDGQKINSTDWRKKFSESIADGILSFQNLSEHKRPPKLLAEYRSERLPLTATIVDPNASAMRAALSYMPIAPLDMSAGLSAGGAIISGPNER